MAKKVFKSDLSVKGIEALKRQLLQYKDVEIQNKCKELVIRLANEGITVGKQNVGGFGKYITFSMKTNPYKDGCKAIMKVEGVGQGTFPNQTHAFDTEGWYWIDLEGNLNHSYGITAKMPMYKASQKIITDCSRIAKEIFG